MNCVSLHKQFLRIVLILWEQDRVKTALDKIEEQETSGHRKRRSNKPIVTKLKDDDSLKVEKSRVPDKNLPKKVRPKGLPPEASLSFDQILKLAAAKQHEPIKLEKKLDVPEKKGPESERLMTKKEKEDLMRRKEEERERQLRKEGKLPSIAPVNPPPVPPTKGKDKSIGRVVPAKEPAITKSPNLISGKTTKVPTLPNEVAKPTVRPNQKDVAIRPNNVQRPGVSKIAQNKLGPPQMKNAPPTPLPQSQLSRFPQGKGKSLAPTGASRPFPPYRDIRPVERPYKSILFSVCYLAINLNTKYLFRINGK